MIEVKNLAFLYEILGLYNEAIALDSSLEDRLICILKDERVKNGGKYREFSGVDSEKLKEFIESNDKNEIWEWLTKWD